MKKTATSNGFSEFDVFLRMSLVLLPLPLSQGMLSSRAVLAIRPGEKGSPLSQSRRSALLPVLLNGSDFLDCWKARDLKWGQLSAFHGVRIKFEGPIWPYVLAFERTRPVGCS